jgi:hypothetical protein
MVVSRKASIMGAISPLLAVFSRNLTACRYSVGVTLFFRMNSLR